MDEDVNGKKLLALLRDISAVAREITVVQLHYEILKRSFILPNACNIPRDHECYF